MTRGSRVGGKVSVSAKLRLRRRACYSGKRRRCNRHTGRATLHSVGKCRPRKTLPPGGTIFRGTTRQGWHLWKPLVSHRHTSTDGTASNHGTGIQAITERKLALQKHNTDRNKPPKYTRHYECRPSVTTGTQISINTKFYSGNYHKQKYYNMKENMVTFITHNDHH